ncbi:MAG: hypothetical protein M3O26_15630 [Pseudomonadota bacterium]|nr:hypothetical protein [Pseudomonadota bacterium]
MKSQTSPFNGKASSRHAKPSAYILATRADRKLNAMTELLKRTMKTLADDFTRVLRQNDTLRGENETLKEMLRTRTAREVAAANAFVAEPLRAPAEIDAPKTITAVWVAGMHEFPNNAPRCSRCGFLRAAIEASGAVCAASA